MLLRGRGIWKIFVAGVVLFAGGVMGGIWLVFIKRGLWDGER